MKIICIVSFMVVLISGCTAKKDWVATGGSRADGIMKLSYEYRSFETPEVNEQQAIKMATERCARWGYTSAEAFGGVVRTCTRESWGRICMVTKEYQCLGDLEK